MHAIIDRQTLKVICRTKHQSELDKTNNPFHIKVTIGEPETFNTFTTLELKMLYRNLGQVMGTNLQQRQSVVTSVMKLLKYLPFTNLDQTPLFNEGAPVKSAKSSPQQAGTGRDRQAANTVAPTRMSGVRSVIWDHADKVWASAGKPTDRAAVLVLRKQMMAELEALGVKRTSSSNELGNWMKDRVPA